MKSSSIRCQTQHTIRTHALTELKRHKIIINVMPRPRQNNSVFIYCKKRVRFRYFCSPTVNGGGSDCCLLICKLCKNFAIQNEY